jgi:hypothetical protein
MGTVQQRLEPCEHLLVYCRCILPGTLAALITEYYDSPFRGELVEIVAFDPPLTPNTALYTLPFGFFVNRRLPNRWGVPSRRVRPFYSEREMPVPTNVERCAVYSQWSDKATDGKRCVVFIDGHGSHYGELDGRTLDMGVSGGRGDVTFCTGGEPHTYSITDWGDIRKVFAKEGIYHAEAYTCLPAVQRGWREGARILQRGKILYAAATDCDREDHWRFATDHALDRGVREGHGRNVLDDHLPHCVLCARLWSISPAVWGLQPQVASIGVWNKEYIVGLTAAHDSDDILIWTCKAGKKREFLCRRRSVQNGTFSPPTAVPLPPPANVFADWCTTQGMGHGSSMLQPRIHQHPEDSGKYIIVLPPLDLRSAKSPPIALIYR